MLRDLPQTLQDLRQSRRPLSQLLLGHIHAADAPGFGAMVARVTVVVFSDYTRKSCLSKGLYLPLLSQRYRADELRVAFRQESNGEQTAASAAEASLAAAAQGRFLPYHECLYNNQHDLTLASIERCASEIQLDRASFKADLTSHRYATQVASDVALAREALIGAPPYLFVNGQRYNGNRGVEGLRALVDEELIPLSTKRSWRAEIPGILTNLSLSINGLAYSAPVLKLAPEVTIAFILREPDRASLAHSTFADEALKLVLSSQGVLRAARNLCVACLLEAVRDRARVVDLNQVNPGLQWCHQREQEDKPRISDKMRTSAS